MSSSRSIDDDNTADKATERTSTNSSRVPAALAATRAAGDQAAFGQGLAEGQSLTLDEAVAAALDTSA